MSCVKSDEVFYIGHRVGESKKSGNPYLMVDYKHPRIGIQMIYTEFPKDESIEIFKNMNMGDNFFLSTFVSKNSLISEQGN